MQESPVEGKGSFSVAYSETDSEYARFLGEELQAEGYVVKWLTGTGENELAVGDYLILVLSQSAVSDDQLLAHLKAALQLNLKILPLRRDNESIGQFDYYLKAHQWIDVENQALLLVVDTIINVVEARDRYQPIESAGIDLSRRPFFPVWVACALLVMVVTAGGFVLKIATTEYGVAPQAAFVMGRAHLKPNVIFHPEIERWDILTPQALSLHNNLRTVTYELEGRLITDVMPDNYGVSVKHLLSPEERDITLTVEDTAGNRFGPFHYQHDFRRDVEVVYQQVTRQDIVVCFEQGSESQWVAQVDERNPVFSPKILLYSLDGDRWQENKGLWSIRFSVLEQPRHNTLYLKYLHGDTGVETPVFEYKY